MREIEEIAGDCLPWYLRWRLPKERPMYLIVGRRGSGKTLQATEYGLSRMRRGERVYANYGIVDRERGLRAGRIHTLLDVMDLRDATVIIDEANLWASAREWSKIPPQVIAAWAESRKRGLSFIFTAQHEERVDKIIRELADWILVCERVPLLPRWVPVFRTHWTFLEEVSQVRRGQVSRAEIVWVPHRAFAAYDTREDIDGAMLSNISAYRAAIDAGKDPDKLGLVLPDRVEPSRFVGGEWVEW